MQKQNSARQQQYKSYLKSAHWADMKALKVQKRPHCQICGQNTDLQLHHVVYRRRFEDSLPSDLRWLCSSCHKTAHMQMAAGLIPRGKNAREIFGITAEVVLGHKDRPWGGVFRVRMPSKRPHTATKVRLQKQVKDPVKAALACGPSGVIVVFAGGKVK